MGALFQNIRQKLQAFAESHPGLVAWKDRLLPEAEKFLIAGPTLIGFVFGITRYQPGSVAFETGFQSLVFFLAYLAALTLVQLADSLFFNSWPMVLGISRSLLAALYLALTLRQYFEWRTGDPKILGPAARLRERARVFTGDAL